MSNPRAIISFEKTSFQSLLESCNILTFFKCSSVIQFRDVVAPILKVRLILLYLFRVIFDTTSKRCVLECVVFNPLKTST